MGASCCSGERKIMGKKKPPKVSLLKHEFNSGETFDAKTTEAKRYSNEAEVDYLTDVYVTTKEALHISTDIVLKNAALKAKDTTIDKAVPFLVVSLDQTKVAVLSKNYTLLDLDINTNNVFTREHTKQTFESASLSKVEFLDNLQNFLLYFF